MIKSLDLRLGIDPSLYIVAMIQTCVQSIVTSETRQADDSGT